MSTVKELFDDAVKCENSILAHYIFFLLQEGKLQLDERVSRLDLYAAESYEFLNTWKNNLLGFDNMKIFSLKQSKDIFIFIFAENTRDARYLYWQEYGQEPINCIELTLDELMDYGNRFMTFRDIKKEMRSFPCIMGYLKKPNLTVRR